MNADGYLTCGASWGSTDDRTINAVSLLGEKCAATRHWLLDVITLIPSKQNDTVILCQKT